MWNVLIALIPALIVVALTQYYLWEKSNRDFLLNKYESAIKFLDWENYKIIEYCTLINNMATRNPEKVDDITYNILTKEFENIDEDIRSLTLEMCNISLVSKYDHSLEKLVGNYAEMRMHIIKNTTWIYSEACIKREWKLEGDKTRRKQHERAMQELKEALEIKLDTTFKNPYYRTFVWTWSIMQETFCLDIFQD